MIPRTNLVEIHQKAGEILFWARDRVSCQIELSSVEQGFNFRFRRRLPGGRLLSWDRMLSYVELDQAHATAQQYGDMIADQFWRAFLAAESGRNYVPANQHR